MGELEELEEKREYEYKIFRMDMMCKSREHIFTKSDEIENMKRIYRIIKQNLKELSEDQRETLLAFDNILDAAYGYFMNQMQNSKVEESTKKWMQNLYQA